MFLKQNGYKKNDSLYRYVYKAEFKAELTVTAGRLVAWVVLIALVRFHLNTLSLYKLR